ncbi:type II toxin-antitoxin system PemK/MazF family toxin [Streptomyces sp. So13.3]|uniref:Type II toxin-antitoxin system PemK/MazF family toxin n=1 Tax=Streptomyces fildesensis TaxID=375757 RepID=A0ABW8C6D6_9ACTN|nr:MULTISPECIES: type II toxin-antitoxin system PemK/MazF family toxin [Streptomyces]MCM2430250.1 type II toxin-antitoxin system PemK/MazF family toxin [Streptomyces sp. RKAG337]MCZ4099268.1 type II toxin-antitoxin system PemK/MazF family toxin [Streptomyces sp. H39-C1]QNA71547.1 type II toxin-antitoxin system PemK/MazF family toxin [Streptomyces sp. So13.3]
MSTSINDAAVPAPSPGREGPTATREAQPHEVGPVRTTYAPDRDGDPDPGEIVWTWVPFEENDGRGKDRPVLVVARESAGTLLAVQLSSKRHDEDREWVPIGTGSWDAAGRESWVDLDRVLRVHPDGMRREACALDRPRFDRVVGRLTERYGWS